MALALAAPLALACAGPQVLFVDNRHPLASDENPGTSERPFRTIERATRAVRPGDKVFVKAGVYNERVVMTRSGENGLPIVFEGERELPGDPLAVIDPSTPIGAGWQLVDGEDFTGSKEGEYTISAEHGVYKRKMARNPLQLTLSGKTISRIRDSAMLASPAADAFVALTAAPDALYPFGDERSIKWWDGLEAVYGHRAGTTYIRFRNGDDPNLEDLRAAPNQDDEISPKLPAVQIHDVSDIVFRSFRVGGAHDGISIAGIASNNLVEDNVVANGDTGIHIVGAGARGNIVRGNTVTYNYFGHADMGAWVGLKTTAERLRYGVYLRHKHIFRMPQRIRLSHAGNGNVVCGNTLFGGLTGITLVGGGEVIRGTRVCDNTIHNLSSVGVEIREDQSATEYSGNLVYDNNINFRLHHFNAMRKQKRTVYLYRNRSWLPEGTGKHIHVHWEKCLDEDCCEHRLEVYLYHNSFAGGGHFLYNAAHQECDTLGSVTAINNLISTKKPLHFQANGSVFERSRSAFGCFDHNWSENWPNPSVTPRIYRRAGWFGPNNIIDSGPGYFWPPGLLPPFTFGPTAPMVDNGLDLSQPFACNDREFPPLPGVASNFAGQGPDIGAFEYR